jgi:ABC-type spermidine/putrescine transport system permease subunit I
MVKNGTTGMDIFAVRVLRAFAWVNLITCIAASFLILREYGVTFVTEEELLFNYTEKVVNPFAISVSLFSFLFGIFGWAFCHVVAHMAENLIAIRQSKTPPPSGGGADSFTL